MEHLVKSIVNITVVAVVKITVSLLSFILSVMCAGRKFGGVNTS